jgi:hypothetical protein
VALSRGSPRVGVTDHPALWSPDLPHRTERPGATARPTHPRTGYADGRLAGARDEEFARHVVDDLVIPVLTHYRERKP